MPLTILLVMMVSLVRMSRGQFTRDSLYHAMNDRGVYLPDDYNSDLPPAQVLDKVKAMSLLFTANLVNYWKFVSRAPRSQST